MRAGVAVLLLLILGLAWPAGPAHAQMTTEDLVDPGPPDGDVRSSTRWQRLQTDVRYLRPEADFKPGEDIEVVVPPRPKDTEEVRSANRLTTGIVVGLIVVAILVVFFLFGNRINVSFGKTTEQRRASREERTTRLGALTEDLPPEGLLDRLAAMADRRRALILLTGHSLERAAEMNGLRIARAQTARDVLRSLPRQWHHMDAIRRLVREAEIVHFGGRDVSEETWATCLATARPFFGKGATA